MKVLFPHNIGKRYYKTHFKFVLDVLKDQNCDISFFNSKINLIETYIEDKRVIFDFADAIEDNNDEECVIFKFHWTPQSKAYSFSPISFYDWNRFNELSTQIQYNPNASGLVTCRQRPYGNAKRRRSLVQGSIKCGKHMLKQEDFWKEINHLLVSVCVPGQRIDILDRGQLQYMAFGACTVSPKLIANLPWDIQLLPDEEYLCCKDDFSDLLDIIEYCKVHPKDCIEIGKSARNKFLQSCTPEKLIEWIKYKL